MPAVDILNVIRQVAATMRQYSSSVSRCNAVLQCRIAYVIACIACDCSRPTSAYNYYAAALCDCVTKGRLRGGAWVVGVALRGVGGDSLLCVNQSEWA